MTSQLPTLCWSCRRLDRSVTAPGSPTPIVSRCEAYPDGIPPEIARGGDHREPRGDEVDSLVFAQASGEVARGDLEMWQRYHDAVRGAG